jgi:hypothetical protein
MAELRMERLSGDGDVFFLVFFLLGVLVPSTWACCVPSVERVTRVATLGPPTIFATFFFATTGELLQEDPPRLLLGLQLELLQKDLEVLALELELKK